MTEENKDNNTQEVNENVSTEVAEAKVVVNEKIAEEDKKPVRVIEQRTIAKIVGITIGVLMILTVLIIFLINSSENRKCNNIYELVKEASIEYVKDEEIVLDVVNPQTDFKLEKLINDGYLEKEDFTNDDIVCGGTIMVTKVEDEYIVTSNLTNCDKCTTDVRYGLDYGQWTSEKPNDTVVDVRVTYNYAEKTVNYSSWTNYLTPAQLEKEPITEDDSRFGTISKDAKNIEILEENITYYRYRDKRWLFYENINNTYTDFYSENPGGYEEKDGATAIKTEWSEWSLTAPVKESYRNIEEKTGYRWYYEEDDIKHYYGDGSYLPVAPDDKHTEREKDDYATIYRYQDTLWRWYNGKEREYSGYISAPTERYPYIDEALTKYSDWSDWELVSEVNDANRSYREEEIEIRTRFRLEFDMLSFDLLEENLSKEKFIQTVGMTLEEVVESTDYALVPYYEYRVREK